MIRQLATLALLATSCGAVVTEPMPDIPETVDYDTVRIEYGDDDLLAATSTRSLVGDPSGISAITQGLIRGTNGIIRANLRLIDAIADTRPTSYADNVWTWDNTNTRRSGERVSLFEIEAIDEDVFAYRWNVGNTADDKVEVFSGEFRKSERLDGQQRGEGILRFDFSNMAAVGLSENPGAGRAAIAFRAIGGVRQVSVATFDVVTPTVPDPATGQYRYIQLPSGSGRLKYSAETNFLNDGEPLENLSIDTVYLPDGTGRAGASLTGGSLTINEVLLHECWDSNARTTFADAMPDLTGVDYEDGTEDACDAKLLEFDLDPPEALLPQGDPEVPGPHPDETEAM